MKYILSLILIITLSCQSVEKYNQFIDKKIEPQLLKDDIDYTYQKLQKFHPNLYWYISKEQLDYKFDSLKNATNKSLSPKEFYFQLAPVVASVREGHLKLRSLSKKYTAKERKQLTEQKPLFSRLQYKIIDNQLYVKENKDSLGGIKVGTEITKINNEDFSSLLKRYLPLFTSDGENKTFDKYFIDLAFFNYFTYEHGYLDSVHLKTKYDNVISDVQLKRFKKSEEEIKKDKEKTKLSTEQKVQDFDSSSKSYNRILKFYQDSTIAYIKIKTFSGTYSKQFYKETFEKIKKNKSQFLILDVRDNLGGSLSEINNLYSYMALKDYTLIKKPEMTFRTSSLHQNYFFSQNWLQRIITAPAYPFFLIGNYFLSSKKGNQYYFYEKGSKINKPKENAFQAKIFVLINGASFSASSIISSKLKFDKRATIIGEETGGANDGTVAGVYNTVTLPNSKLKLPIGLFLIQPNIEFENQNRGVFPDVITSQDFDQLNPKEDSTLKWALENIKSNP